MFALLMRVRLLSSKNSVLESVQRRPLISLLMAIVALTLFAAVFFGFYTAITMADGMGRVTRTMQQTLFYLFLFLFAGAVPFVSSTLLQSADYQLLFASPISPRAVVAAKLIDATVTNSLQFSVLGIPALIACAAVSRITGGYWIAMPVVICLFALLPALLTALLLLILLCFVGMKRLRSAVTLLNALTGTVVCLSVLSRIGLAQTARLQMSMVVQEHIKSLTEQPGIASIFPTAWFAELIQGMAHGSVTTVLRYSLMITGLVGMLFGACMVMGSKLLSAASLAEEGEYTGIGSGRVKARTNETINKNPKSQSRKASPTLAVLRKDITFVIRDTVLMSQTAMPLILYLVPFILGASDRSLRDLIGPLAVTMTGIILFMQTSILSLSSIGLESRAFWILRSSPVKIRTVLKAKFLWSTVASASISVILTVFTSVIFELPYQFMIGFSLLFIATAMGLCGIGVGISASFPKFVYDNPSLRVSAWALILGFIASTIYTLATGAIILISFMIQWRSSNESHNTIFAVAIGTIVILTAVCVYVPLTVGGARLENYEWEH